MRRGRIAEGVDRVRAESGWRGRSASTGEVVDRRGVHNRSALSTRALAGDLSPGDSPVTVLRAGRQETSLQTGLT